ncbi:MAG TPA: VOC family protein [Solirubrobacterales bacterium]|jgi:catechol 2,3-dioxygenase-like lactoylglutathione lyase family enzyme|nr:VOC family protein [Solirubrobacterales bacterium]
MSSTDATGQAASASDPPKPGEVRLEVVTVPVSDVDRAKAFYESLGWKLDIDIEPGEGVRIVQFTPPGSGCSISFGKGITPAEPGSFQGSELAVYDIDAAREDLIGRGIEVSELYHLDGGPVPGPDPERQSYRTFASFKDPDGNTWQLQEIKERLPGR